MKDLNFTPSASLRKFSELISVVFHPVLLPSLFFSALAFGSPTYILQLPPGIRWMLLGLIVTLTFVVPVVLLVLMLRARMISSLLLNNRLERNGPVLVTAIFLFITYYLLDYLSVASIFGYYLLCATSIALLTMMINPFWKISLHAIGHGAHIAAWVNLAMMVSLPLMLVLVSIVIGGLTATSRLLLHAHTPAEIYGGFLLGIAVMTFLFQIVI